MRRGHLDAADVAQHRDEFGRRPVGGGGLGALVDGLDGGPVPAHVLGRGQRRFLAAGAQLLGQAGVYQDDVSDERTHVPAVEG
jgi:hypothetical protein